MTLVSAIARHRKAVASGLAIAIVAAIPISFAIVHQGFPETDVQLDAKDVWVTNGGALLGGRLNRQIEELNGAVSGQSHDLDVVQDGESVFLLEAAEGRISRVDPAYTTLVEPATIPKGSSVALGGTTLAIVSPAGFLWTIDVSNGLTFDPATKPVAKLGAGGQAVVTPAGVTLAVSEKNQTLVTVQNPGTPPVTKHLAVPQHAQVAAAGDRAVVLDAAKHQLLRDDGSTIALPDAVTSIAKLQQSGADASQVAIETGDSAVIVGLGDGKTRTLDAKLDSAATTAAQLSQPVVVDGCVHAAWGGGQRYLLACAGQPVRTENIEQQTTGAVEFRVNRSVVALNDLENGNVWLLDDQMRLVKNWDQVTPPKQDETTTGNTKAATQSFQDTLAQRTEVNHPPIARDDNYGVRPNRTTILPVLSNDTDPDGDVLTIPKFSDVPESVGKIDVIDGGRALQFTPADGASAASFRYTVDDGRAGGVAEALVTVRVVPNDQNNAPTSQRTTAVSVELGGTISYNVLADWVDPDGDDVYLDSAVATSADDVRFTPDGFVTFANTSGQPGTKEINFTVSDGRLTSTGQLEVKVVPAGSLSPIGTPDYAQVFRGKTVALVPLDNDVSNNGQPKTLLGVDKVPAGATVVPDLQSGSVTFSAPTVGTYYFQYSLATGAASSIGLVRVDVLPDPTAPGPPIAVKDTAFLRAGEPTSVKVLNNDVSPSGAVLAVQSVDLTGTDPAVSIEVLSNAVVRITATAALTAQTQFHYTVSDGTQTSVAGVTIVPVPPIVNRQPPIAAPDRVRVRAGDVVSADVLANDVHPDDAQLILDPQLVDTTNEGDGLAFVGDGKVRYQAGETPGEFSVVYRVGDQFGESATATVTFVVVAPDLKTNQAPVPLPQVARVFAGSTVPIQVPLDGIDPDGDSVVVTGVDTVPHLGILSGQTSDTFQYTALAGSAGTDSFTYFVADSYGEQAVGTIEIAVIPRPVSAEPPNAVDDSVEVMPGRVATVGVMLNDSDPSGYTIALDRKLIEVDPGVSAKVDGSKIIVQAAKTEGTYSIRYRITNGHGGEDTAFLQVKVTKNAKPLYPTAIDKYVSVNDVVGKSSVAVPLDKLVANPGGLDNELKISVEGPNAGQATVDQAKRSITVKPGERRVAIAYRVTNPVDGLSATAIISVPPAVSANYSPPPYLRRDIGQQVVPQNTARTWKLADIVTVPSGKPAILTELTDVSATHGTATAADNKTITFTPEDGFRGAASITFKVTDGTSKDDPNGHPTLLTMPLQVGDPNFTDVAPQFVTQNVTVEAGEDAKTIDLKASTTDPNPALIDQFRYDSLTGASDTVSASLSGSALNVSSPIGTQPGAKTTLHFQLHYKDFNVQGTVNVTVVSSTRPLAQAVPDAAKGQRAHADTVNVLANDYNPFASKNQPLKVIEAHIENAAESGATMAYTPSGDVTIKPNASFIGVVSVVYTDQDATKDPARNVTGRLQYTVRDVPGQPNPPTFVEGDSQVLVSWSPPATNGEPITGYTITWTGGSPVTVDGSVSNHNFTGLANGTGYTFRVTATNVLGPGVISGSSNTAIPFGKPAAPGSVSAAATNNGSGVVNVSWGTAANNGRAVTDYQVSVNSGPFTSVGNVTSYAFQGDVGTAYAFRVQAVNAGGAGAPSASSASVTPVPGAPSSATADWPGPKGTKTVNLSWGAAPTHGPAVTYQISVNSGAWKDEGSATSDSVTGEFDKATSFQVRATAGGATGPVKTSNSATPKDIDPYSIKLCYGGPEGNGNAIGVTWSGSTGSHHITFSGFGSTLDFSAASGSQTSGAWNARNTSGDLNTTINWTDNGTPHSTRWGDANAC